jgi:hypothetical protein
MTEDRLTTELVRRLMDWKITPDRFITSGRSWTPRWRFNPMTSIDDAFQLLDRSGARYRLTAVERKPFTAEVWVGDRRGEDSGERKAKTITVALARALDFDL